MIFKMFVLFAQVKSKLLFINNNIKFFYIKYIPKLDGSLKRKDKALKIILKLHIIYGHIVHF